MITRTHTKGDAPSTAVYSDCERYRYLLTRVWEPAGRKALFIMLNPSTATEVQNDPTVERCERRARTLGFGGFSVTNIFAWRDTDPKKMRAAAEPIGAENDVMIAQSCDWADQIIAAWGAHGTFTARCGDGSAFARHGAARFSPWADKGWPPEASTLYCLYTAA